ncbi:hypothetical protein M501DRAFT_993639 [Patellaria atrata CBS 101060]|uniref:Uncharacterized protein n=1 Tax=Patellaria atrata CBS 101060 TaxID=1346257 RepID=A0A9P4SJC1_9PEZI|nr:hypothetical protein M501DRAFT_993639 [Patellaria atrata CBS 101060]
MPDRSLTMEGSANRNMSHGRGGAGNIGKERRESFTKPEDLVTPTIKSDIYTTGRGGSGNMSKNDPAHPELARAAQDVDAPAHREPESTFHIGRGGAANIVKPTEEEVRKSKEINERRSSSVERDTHTDTRGLAEKVLGKIGLGGHKS